jgi:hypothetical protein
LDDKNNSISALFVSREAELEMERWRKAAKSSSPFCSEWNCSELFDKELENES